MKTLLNISGLSCILLLSGCGAGQNSTQESENPVSVPQQDKSKVVEVREVTAEPFLHYIEVQGIADTDKNILVMAKTSGAVEAVNVQEGARVKKGQDMIRLDDDIIRNSISEVRTSLDLATSLYEKQKGLWEKNIGSEVQYLQAKNNKESLERRLATLREQLAMTRVKSPIDGVVDAVNIKQGEMASPGMPLVRVVNLEDFEIKATVAENYSLSVKEGTEVIVDFPDLKKSIQSEIAFVGNVIDPINRTFDIIVRISETDVPIKPNMIAVVRILDFQQKEAVVVPVNTILTDKDEKFVFVATEQEGRMVARKRSVKPEMNYRGQSLISEGLEPGDKLITFGFQDLTEGEIIRF